MQDPGPCMFRVWWLPCFPAGFLNQRREEGCCSKPSPRQAKGQAREGTEAQSCSFIRKLLWDKALSVHKGGAQMAWSPLRVPPLHPVTVATKFQHEFGRAQTLKPWLSPSTRHVTLLGFTIHCFKTWNIMKCDPPAWLLRCLLVSLRFVIFREST